MSEPAAAATADTTPDTDTDDTSAEETLGDAGKKALDREREARKRAEAEAKKNADAARRLADIEESQKTETQKLTDKLTEASGQIGELSVENSRLRVALRHGLTEDQARRLIGSTEEDLDDDAGKLKESLGLASNGETTPTPALPQRPREQLRSGSQPAIPIGNDDALTAALKKKLGVS